MAIGWLKDATPDIFPPINNFQAQKIRLKCINATCIILEISTSTKSSTSYGIVDFSSSFAALQLGFGIDLLFLYHTLHLTETRSLAWKWWLRGISAISAFFTPWRSAQKDRQCILALRGIPDYCPTTHCCVRFWLFRCCTPDCMLQMCARKVYNLKYYARVYKKAGKKGRELFIGRDKLLGLSR